jgi:hypothetical protein
MTTLETFASFLLLPILLACLWRARLLALAIVPPLALAIVQAFDLVDTSSASHPLRFVVPVLSMSVAMYSAQLEVRWPLLRAKLPDDHTRLLWRRDYRPLVASILVFASGCGDIPALLAWRIPGEWILVPVQVGVEILILGVLCAPERWFHGHV